MEYENNFAKKGTAGTALGLSIGALGLTALNGGLGNVLGGVGCGRIGECAEDHFINRYELNMQNTITNKDMEIAYLKGRDAAKSDSLELYRYIDGRFNAVERELADNRTWNAVATSNISCMQSQIAGLLALTKTVIPAENICPAPMPQYNSWTAPTTTG